MHRVRKNKHVKEGRYCLSFRSFVSSKKVQCSSTPLTNDEASKPVNSATPAVASQPAARAVNNTPVRPGLQDGQGQGKKMDFSSGTDGFSSFTSKSNITYSSVGSIRFVCCSGHL